ncbi:MAG: hypothetical protein ABJB85_07580 [Nitrososphaerota archaeon]
MQAASFIGAGIHGGLSNLRQSPITLGSQSAGSCGGGGGTVGQFGLVELQTSVVPRALLIL